MKSLFNRVTDLRAFHLNSAKFLTILTGKTEFFSVQFKNDWLAASDLFDVYTQSITFYYYTIKSTDVWKMWFIIIDSKNEWLLLPGRFTAKFGLVFDLTLEKAFP